MLASRAATGMLLVLATRVVRFMIDSCLGQEREGGREGWMDEYMDTWTDGTQKQSPKEKDKTRLPSGVVIVSSGKSFNTSAISFPRSPHPT